MEKLLLVPLELRDLPLLALVIRLKLLHQLFVRLDQSRILDERSNLVALVRLSVIHWLLGLFAVVQVIYEGRVQVDRPRELFLKVGN